MMIVNVFVYTKGSNEWLFIIMQPHTADVGKFSYHIENGSDLSEYDKVQSNCEKMINSTDLISFGANGMKNSIHSQIPANIIEWYWHYKAKKFGSAIKLSMRDNVTSMPHYRSADQNVNHIISW